MTALSPFAIEKSHLKNTNTKETINMTRSQMFNNLVVVVNQGVKVYLTEEGKHFLRTGQLRTTVVSK